MVYDLKTNGPSTHSRECKEAAISVITIYELFRRTFGFEHCTLSLSYCLTTAASVFLLEIQGADIPDTVSLESLEFCIEALEEIRTTNLGISIPAFKVLQC